MAKNTEPALQTAVTEEHAFALRSMHVTEVLAVRAGQPVPAALELASHLLDTVGGVLAALRCMGPQGGEDVDGLNWAAVYLTETARAIVQSALIGVHNQQAGGGV